VIRNSGVVGKMKADELSKKLSFFVILLGVLAPAGYLIGVSFHQGTLHAYGVLPDSLPISVQDSYVTAYYAVGYVLLAIAKAVIALLKTMLTLKGGVITACVVLVIVLLVYAASKAGSNKDEILSHRWVTKVRRLVSYLHWKNNAFTRALGITSLASYLFLLVLYFSMVLGIFWFAVPYAAFVQGSSVAKEKRNTYLQKSCFAEDGEVFGNCHTLTSEDGKIVVEGLLVVHSGNMIAFFTKNGSYVSEFPKGAVLSKHLYE